tara:strand:- start:3157 stop:4110 length:954 start_codon:yes stop_codon:yes gene_type:complete
MQYTEHMHRAIIEALIETSKKSLEDGPKPGLSVTHESEHSNGGYLTIDALLYCLTRVLTDERPTRGENPANGPLICGLVSFEESQHFNSSISNINPDLAHYCRLCLKTLNERAHELGVWDQQVWLPWCIIKKVMIIYYDKFTFKMMGDDTNPLYSTENDRILEGIVERVPDGPSTNGEWLISVSCSSILLKWINELAEKYFIEEGDCREITWPGWIGTGDIDEVSDYTSEDICKWWATEMRPYLPSNGEFWGEESQPQPPNYPPPSSRPVTVEPINQTKKKLTEILAFIEEKKEIWSMNEGDYLKISDLMKEAFDSV